MSLEAIARLEKLVDRLLTERVEMQERNRALSGECDRLVQDRTRVSEELVDGWDGYVTDPLDPDSDDDGMPDGWEVDNNLNPLVDDGGLDPDGDQDQDGLSLRAEMSWGTDPQNSDSDGDGLGDGEEIEQELDPLGPGAMPKLE